MIRLLLLLFILTSCSPVVQTLDLKTNKEINTKVISVVDGDTLDILVNKTPVRLRLYGIDAPEKKQPFGTKAKENLSKLVFNKTVEVLPLRKEKYGRYLAKVRSPEGIDLSEEQVKKGLAWWYYKFAPKDQSLKNLESEARTKKLGIWSVKGLQPAWEGR
jgi:micrococcal nuclease